MANIIIVGAGEVGTAMFEILRHTHDVELVEGERVEQSPFDLLGIAFPFGLGFVAEVKKYQDWYKPRHTVIFSTVPPGTCRKLGATHSPCVGIHPHLEEGIKTFTRWIGGDETGEVAHFFRRAGLRVYCFDKPETTELMKIECTSKYGLDIEHAKQVRRDCEKFGVPFEAWSLWTRDYSEGYAKLGHPEYARPNLIPIMTPIGGHCVRPNLEMLENPFTEFVKSLRGC